MDPDYALVANLHYGFIIPHYKDMHYFIQKHILGAEISFVKYPSYACNEEIINCKIPERGISLVYLNLGNPQVLGSGIAVLPFMNFSVIRSQPVNVFFKIGTGLGYISKPFDRVTNHKDYAIGSHLNAFINLRLNAGIRLSERILLETGLGLSHFSNGSFTMPNLGINICTANLGMRYNIGSRACVNPDSVNRFEPKKYFIIYAATGLKEISPPGGKKYPCFNISINRERKFSLSGRYLYGLELTYNGANYADFKRDTLIHVTAIQNIQVGIKAGYSLVAGRLSFPVEMGIYLYSYEKDPGLIFHRIGLRYQLTKKWTAVMTLKTHWSKADFIELGVGYSFNTKLIHKK